MRAIELTPLVPDAGATAAVIVEVLEAAPNRDAVADHVRSVIEGQRALYERTNPQPPWIGYLAWDEQSGELVGSCSFIAKDGEESVEIAYFTFPPYEGTGVASAMARELLAIAAAAGGPALHAFTLPEDNASTAILRKLGFGEAGEALDEDAGRVWRWERRGEPA